MSENHRNAPRTVIGPTLTVALPFSTITTDDAELRARVADLATLVARLSRQVAGADPTEMAELREAADDLVARLSPPTR